MATAEYVIVVFLDTTKSYNWVKDVQSCGAAIQNMLLTACSLEVGSCWIGEVVDYAQDVKSILGVSSEYLELMGMVTLGSADRSNITRDKTMCTKRLDDFLIK
jgi:nitroreductase